ncbi:hypothetical protein Bbelb_305160 [Branchiostoma belcheri]|nr:hypothetical protein Bbelb_305160 [Branchiostoma belcheri]
MKSYPGVSRQRPTISGFIPPDPTPILNVLEVPSEAAPTRVICGRRDICCRGSFCRGEKDSRSNNPSLRGKNSLGSKSSLAAAYYSRRSQKKNNADAQQDCEGG